MDPHLRKQDVEPLEQRNEAVVVETNQRVSLAVAPSTRFRSSLKALKAEDRLRAS